jgi:hypothetical protein
MRGSLVHEAKHGRCNLHAAKNDICTQHPVDNGICTVHSVEQDRCTLQGYLAHRRQPLPPSIAIGPWAYSFWRILGGCCFV